MSQAHPTIDRSPCVRCGSPCLIETHGPACFVGEAMVYCQPCAGWTWDGKFYIDPMALADDIAREKATIQDVVVRTVLDNVEVPESAKHFDEPIPWREGYNVEDVVIHVSTGGGTCGRVRHHRGETWRDRPSML